MDSSGGSVRRTRPIHHIRELQARYDELVRQHAAAEATRAALVAESFVLHLVCEALALLQLNVQKQRLQLRDARQHAALEALLEAEGELLQQLARVPFDSAAVASQQALLKAASTVSSQPTLAPASDPMALLRVYALRPPLPDTHSVTSMELTQRYKAGVQQISMQLHLLDAGISPREEAMRDIQAAVDGMMHMLTSYMLGGKCHAVAEYAARNAATLALKEPGSPGRAAAMAVAVAGIGLTPEQEEVIARTVPVWLRTLGSVTREMRQLLQQQQHGSSAGGRSSSGSSGGAGDSGGAAAAGLAGAAAAAHGISPPVTARLHSAQQHLDRLGALMNKQTTLNLAFRCWFVGRLTAVQVARMDVLCWPYPASYLQAGIAIRQQWQQRQQQPPEEGVAAWR